MKRLNGCLNVPEMTAVEKIETTVTVESVTAVETEEETDDVEIQIPEIETEIEETGEDRLLFAFSTTIHHSRQP